MLSVTQNMTQNTNKISYKASESPYRTEEFLPTGLPKLDAIIGGGIARGRITELVGNKSTGKTTLALTFIRECQKKGLRCVFADAENALNFQRAEELGVDLDKMTVIHADCGEAYLDEVQRMVDEGDVDIVIIDSIPSLSPRREQEEDNTTQIMGAHPRMIAKFLRKIILSLRKNKVALLLINHITVDFATGQEKSPGGKALEYYKSVQIHMRLHPQGALKQGEKQVGNKYILKIKKSKVSAPFGQCDVTLLYDSGYSFERDLLEQGILDGTITKRGNTYFFGETKIGVGAAKAADWLKDKQLSSNRAI